MARDRVVSTKAGDIAVRIPKLRQWVSPPPILERRRRIDRALFAVVMEAYVHGVSTRKVDDLVQALGRRLRISKSEVVASAPSSTRISRPSAPAQLDHVAFPYLFCDATYVKGRLAHHVVSRAVVVATGVGTVNGGREVLGVCRRRQRGQGLLVGLSAERCGPEASPACASSSPITTSG